MNTPDKPRSAEQQKRLDRHHTKLQSAGLMLRKKLKTSGDDALLTEYEAAEYLSKSVQWMRNMRCYGGGPVVVKIGGGVRYRMAELRAYAQPVQQAA